MASAAQDLDGMRLFLRLSVGFPHGPGILGLRDHSARMEVRTGAALLLMQRRAHLPSHL